MTTTNAQAFITFESQELVSAVGARIALALLRREVGGDLTKAATAINQALSEHKGADNRRYWLAPNGEVPRTTKELKSHHKKYWQIAGNLLSATAADSGKGFTALPETNTIEDILDWMSANDLANATLEMLEKALGRTPSKGGSVVSAGRSKGTTANTSTKAPTEADAVNPDDAPEAAKAMAYGQTMEALYHGLSNALEVGAAMPTDSNKALTAKIAHYEAAIRETLAAVAPAPKQGDQA